MEHPDYLLRRLTSRQLAEWMCYFSEHPFGQDYSDHMTAQVAAMVYNAHRGRHAQPVKAADFMPRVKQQEQTPEQMKDILRSVLRGHRQNH